MRAINILGSKASNAHRYPAPTHDLIIEPFAGGAGYSLFHHERDVLLVDCRQSVYEVWLYLIRTEPDEVRALPMLTPGQHVRDLDVLPGARRLISWCTDQSMAPKGRLSRWAKETGAFWSPSRREQCAIIAGRVKHWRVLRSDYRTLRSDVRATWFIDPPYQHAPEAYDTRPLDYPELAAWCRSRLGQVIVCERPDAKWLPFREVYSVPRTGKVHGGPSHSAEGVWTRG